MDGWMDGCNGTISAPLDNYSSTCTHTHTRKHTHARTQRRWHDHRLLSQGAELFREEEGGRKKEEGAISGLACQLCPARQANNDVEYASNYKRGGVGGGGSVHHKLT